MFEHEKVFKIIGFVLATEQSIKSYTLIFQDVCLNFKSAFTIFKEFVTFGATSGVHLIMAVSAYIYKNKTYMKVSASNINVKIHHQFFNQWILGVSVTIEQQIFSGELTKQTWFVWARLMKIIITLILIYLSNAFFNYSSRFLFS